VLTYFAKDGSENGRVHRLSSFLWRVLEGTKNRQACAGGPKAELTLNGMIGARRTGLFVAPVERS